SVNGKTIKSALQSGAKTARAITIGSQKIRLPRSEPSSIQGDLFPIMLARDLLLIAHAMHVAVRVFFKFLLTFNRAEVDRLVVIVEASGCLGDIHVHFAHRIDRHGILQLKMDSEPANRVLSSDVSRTAIARNAKIEHSVHANPRQSNTRLLSQ